MADSNRSLLDTWVVIDLGEIDPGDLPDDSAIASITLAELANAAHVRSRLRRRARFGA